MEEVTFYIPKKSLVRVLTDITNSKYGNTPGKYHSHFSDEMTGMKWLK